MPKAGVGKIGLGGIIGKMPKAGDVMNMAKVGIGKIGLAGIVRKMPKVGPVIRMPKDGWDGLTRVAVGRPTEGVSLKLAKPQRLT